MVYRKRDGTMTTGIHGQKTNLKKSLIARRFDGFLPIVIDVETGGSNAATDALLELAAILIECDESGFFVPGKMYNCHIEPFEGGQLNPKSLEINRIDPYHPFRFAIPEEQALLELFQFADEFVQAAGCRRAVLVGHNAHFDLGFIQAAAKRCKLKHKNPFHTYTVLDTATLGGVVYGKTVLAKALKAAGISFDKNEAHSAIYDAQQTTKLFCKIVNNHRV